MPTIQEKLTEILRKQLANGNADLETLANGHVCGHVVSSEFVGRDYEDRRMRIREVIDECVTAGDLTRDEVVQISTLFAYTPDEWSVVVSAKQGNSWAMKTNDN